MDLESLKNDANVSASNRCFQKADLLSAGRQNNGTMRADLAYSTLFNVATLMPAVGGFSIRFLTSAS
jgi:hypothetical protein